MEPILLAIGIIFAIVTIWTIVSFYIPTKFMRSLLTGIKDVKEGKISKSRDVFKKMKDDEKWEKANPIKARIIHFWYNIRSFWFEIPDMPRDFCNEIKYVYQRVNRGWSNRDAWNTGPYIAQITYEMLKHHKKVANGYAEIIPLPEDVILGSGSSQERLYHKECKKIWYIVLDKIIFAYKLNTQLGNGERDNYYPPDVIKEINPNLRKLCKNLTKKEEDARQEGMTLFNKYIHYIWN